jgi:hypothetical protein
MVVAQPSPAIAAGSPAVPPDKPCVGVLFVHGAGDHKIGQTLIEFGEPVVTWLDGWLRRGVASTELAFDRALTGATQIVVREGDKGAPAHSFVRLKSQLDPTRHTWLLAEARWDEAFRPPDFDHVLRWSLGVVPWTVLTQFIGPLARQARFVESNPLDVAWFLLRVAISAIGALVASAIVLTLAILILILSLIPLDSVRSVVGALQRFASTGVGDLYLVLTSSVQRAALSSAVQRDIAWLRSQGCDRIAVVAHSQGGYVAYQALSDPWHPTVDLFVTLGSGVIRLTESERYRRTNNLVYALIGTLGALIAIRYLPSALASATGLGEKNEADSLAFAIGATVSLLLVIVLWRYFHDTRGVADLPTPIPWYDFLTTEDPVMNRRRDGLLPRRVQQIRTQNRGSVAADHSAYWANRDQFVSQVVTQIGLLDPGLDLLRAGPKPSARDGLYVIAEASKRRRGRVTALRRRRVAVLVSTALVLVALLVQGYLEQIGQPILDRLPQFVKDLVPDFVFTILPIQGYGNVIVGALVVVALVGVATLVGSQLWNRWTQLDTEKVYAGTAVSRPESTSSPQVLFYVWSLLQLAILVLFAIFGPDRISKWTDATFTGRNDIVGAWAQQYVWTLVVGFAAFLWASSPSRTSGRSAQIRVIGGITLALSLELVLAILFPNAELGWLAIFTAVIIGAAAVALIWLIWPGLEWVVKRFAHRIEDTSKQKPHAAHPANVIDYLGSIGLLIAIAAVALLRITPDKTMDEGRMQATALLLGFVAFAFGLLLAANRNGVRPASIGPLKWLLDRIPRANDAWGAVVRMTSLGSQPWMRWLGVLTMVVGGLAALAAVGRIAGVIGP